MTGYGASSGCRAMETKIRNRAILIVVTVAVCVGGIVGLPKNIQQLRENLGERIRLGLDLKGGTHLVLQVNVEDAVNLSSDQAMERLRDGLRTRNIAYADVQKTDSTHLLIKGISQERSADI